MKVVVLGASGMLGSMVLDYLSRGSDLELAATARDRDLLRSLPKQVTNVEWRFLDAEDCAEEGIAAVLGDAAWAVNAIGVIKPHIHDDNAAEVERAVKINALFPHVLAHAAEQVGCRVLQIATDCVFSGRRGRYAETDGHDPLDVYGKTKSLGEVFSKNVHHLRCSIIGPEPKGHLSLMDWFLAQSGSVAGYSNHQWNGLTTLHFARICWGVIKRGLELPHMQHVIPRGRTSKAGLLKRLAREYPRAGISVTSVHSSMAIDRTLATMNDPLNQHLWEAAGYERPPSVPEMIAELSKFDYRFSGEMT